MESTWVPRACHWLAHVFEQTWQDALDSPCPSFWSPPRCQPTRHGGAVGLLRAGWLRAGNPRRVS